jgi:hypothetical protein
MIDFGLYGGYLNLKLVRQVCKSFGLFIFIHFGSYASYLNLKLVNQVCKSLGFLFVHYDLCG